MTSVKKKCCKCVKNLGRDVFTKTQWKFSESKRKCKNCSSHGLEEYKSSSISSAIDDNSGMFIVTTVVGKPKSEFESSGNENILKITQLNNELLLVKAALAEEKHDRMEESAGLKNRIKILEEECVTQKSKMVLRALSTALQSAMVRKFPEGTFSKKYPWTVTYDIIVEKAAKLKDNEINKILRCIVESFNKCDILEVDIGTTLKAFRELGTSTSHPTTVLNGEGVEIVPTFDDLLYVVEHIPLSYMDGVERKDARSILGTLKLISTTDNLLET